MAEKIRLIIDTDAGLDDAQAIMMALNSPDAEVVAITTCHGNTDADQVCRNVLRLLKVANRLDIPVYRGCSRPMTGQLIDATHYHGLDGFGDVPDQDAPDITHAQPEHAVTTLIKLVTENPGALTLVALAPSTNIALALRLEPNLGSKLKACYMMGGNYQGKGNVTPSAEFNFYADPEAASVVLSELDCPIYLACWELCLKHSLPWDDYEAMRCDDKRIPAWFKRMEKQTMTACRQLGWPRYTPCDELAMAMALSGSAVISESMTCPVTVETSGRCTRAQMIVHRAGQHGSDDRGGKKIVIVTGLKEQMYLDILHRGTQL